jgi:hypothetical protein
VFAQPADAARFATTAMLPTYDAVQHRTGQPVTATEVKLVPPQFAQRDCHRNGCLALLGGLLAEREAHRARAP